MTSRMTPIPGPNGHPILGGARELRRDLLAMLEQNFKRYGDLVLYHVGPVRGPSSLRREMVAVHHPDAVQLVLSDEEVFTRRTTPFRVLSELFGENLATASGDSWRRQRRTLQPLFTPSQVDRYAAVMKAEARSAVESPPPSGLIDVRKLMESYTLRVLGRTLFQDGPGIDQSTAGALARLVPIVERLVQARVTALVRAPLAWPTPASARFRSTQRELYATVDRMLTEQPAGPADAGEGLVSLLRAVRDPETGGSLSLREIRDQALVFMLAGLSTTTSGLTSTVFLLARNPDVQERVAASAASCSRPDAGCDLVLAAVREGLRLYPPAHVIGRRVSAGTEIDGHAIAAGTDVLVSPWVTHRHPAFWPDAERFEPDRFLGAQRRPQYAYFPFGGGGRTCIGRHFALLEMTTMVRELLRAYRLAGVDEDLPRAELMTLRPSGPVRVRCQRR